MVFLWLELSGAMPKVLAWFDKSRKPATKMLGWLDNNQKTATWAAASLLFILLNYLKDVTVFRYDAADYWNLGSLTTLLTTPDVMRGYFFALLLSPAKFLSDYWSVLGYAPYRILSSLVYAYVFADLVPDFYHAIFGGRLSFWRRLVVPVLIAAIFPGLLVYPLSDVPAFALMLGSLACARRSGRADNGPIKRYLLLALAGLLCYGAYNTRTIYLFPAMLTLPIIAAVMLRSHRLQVKLLAVAAFMAGASIASLPQMYVNAELHGVWSPAVISDYQGGSLFAKQLIWGMTVQRYETSLDPPPDGPAVFYMDPAGEQLFLSENIQADSFSVRDYIDLMVRRPLDFLGIFGRHIVNGLDVRDGDSYVRGRSRDKGILAFCNFLVVFAGLAIMAMALVANPPVDRTRAEPYIWALLCLLPVFAIIPGSIETRYFLALDIGIYSAIAFHGKEALMSGVFKRHWLALLAAFALSAALFFSVSTTTMANSMYQRPVPFRIN